MSRTKTATPTLDPAEQSRETLAEAQRKLADTRATLAAANTAVETLRDRARVDDSITGADLASAKSDVDLAEIRQSEATSAVQRAERGLVNTETVLAETLVAVVQDVTRVTPTVATGRPSEVPADLPAVFIVQAKPSKADTLNGTISGSVEVIFYRSEVHRALDDARLGVLADRSGLRLDVRPQGNRDDNGVIVEAVRLDVRSARAPLPVIRRAPGDEWRVTHFATAVAGDVRHSMQLHDAPLVGVRLGSGDASVQQSTVNVTTETPSEVSDKVDTDGVRHRVVEIAVTAQPGQGNVWNSDQMRDKMIHAIEAQHGTCASGLGRVSSVNVLSVEPAGRSGRRVRARFDFVSQLPETV